MIQHELIQTGCFVYQVVRSDKVVVRSTPEILDDDDDAAHLIPHNPTSRATDIDEDDDDDDEQEVSLIEEEVSCSPSPPHFENNELLAIDLIQPTTYAVFLRLADQSGWVVAEQYGELYLRQLRVEHGRDRLYCFYVDYPGLVVRRHPMDDSSGLLSSEVANNGNNNWQQRLYPLQKIYCDARVQHPVTGVQFYRLQSTSSTSPATPGWVHDKQIAYRNNNNNNNNAIISAGGAKSSSSSSTTDIVRLLEENMVQTGLFAFRAIQGAAVRQSPDCLETSKNGLAVQRDEMIAVDVIRTSPYAKGNGPFLHLADNSGWLFEHKLGQRILEPVALEQGLWNIMVLNEPVGLGLRTHPVDRQDKLLKGSHEAYLPGTKLECNAKVVAHPHHNGVTFYRVRGTNGWLFDKRGDKPMLELLSSNDGGGDTVPPPLTTIKEVGWPAEFVRGIASTVSGVKELSHDPQQQVMTFENTNNIQFHIFCKSKTVCTVFEHPVTGKVRDCQRNCTPHQLHSILGKNTIDAMTMHIIREQTEGPVNGEEEKKQEDELMTPTTGPADAAATKRPPKSATEKEEALRKELLECDAAIADALEKRRNLVKVIKGYDNERAVLAAQMMSGPIVDDDEEDEDELTNSPNRPDTFSEELLSKQSRRRIYSSSSNTKQAALLMSTTSNNSMIDEQSSTMRSQQGGGGGVRSIASTQNHHHHHHQLSASFSSASAAAAAAPENNSSSSNAARIMTVQFYVCRECFQTFSGKYSRDLHCRHVHKLFCGECDRVFTSTPDFEAHKDIAGHW